MSDVHSRVLLLVISATVAAACGSNASLSPTAPSAGGAGTSGAVIVGRVSGASAPIVARDTASANDTRDTSSTFVTLATSSITVKITGTNISTTTDGQGQFTLTGVPPGNVQLEFSGQGTSARIVISGVSAQDEINISVTLNGNNAHVDSERRTRRNDDHNNDRNEISGPVVTLGGTCPTLAFIVQGTRVTTSASTEFKGVTCANLKNGVMVEVKGSRGADGAISASRINIEDVDDDDQDEMNGAVAGLTGSCPTLAFSVKSTKVTTTASTTFERVTCARVQNGRIVQVNG